MLGAPVPCPRSWLVSASRELCGVDEAGAQSVVRSFGMSYLYEPAAKAPALPRARAAPASTGTALVCEILYSSRKRGALKSEISLTQARSGPRLNPDITYTAAHRIQDLYISACQAASTPSMFELRVCTPPLLRGETVLLGCCVPETGKQNPEPFDAFVVWRLGNLAQAVQKVAHFSRAAPPLLILQQKKALPCQAARRGGNRQFRRLETIL